MIFDIDLSWRPPFSSTGTHHTTPSTHPHQQSSSFWTDTNIALLGAIGGGTILLVILGIFAYLKFGRRKGYEEIPEQQ